MCRSIRVLRTQPRATGQDVEAAARQFVRKVSGFAKPSSKNEAAFEKAVAEIAGSVERLLAELPEYTGPNGMRMKPRRERPAAV
jgi:hypothetical protein